MKLMSFEFFNFELYNTNVATPLEIVSGIKKVTILSGIKVI